jgi:hypothetical protein
MVAGDDDAQLALHCIYELSYRGWVDVDARFEVDGSTLALRRSLEDRLEAELRDAVGPMPTNAHDHLVALSTGTGGRSLSQFIDQQGTTQQVREFLIHRSAYQLKEADPHTWGLPRLSGRAKAAFATIQHDEYGAGQVGQAHADLFAQTMRALDLDDRYGHYLPALPGVTLATGNLISMLGLQRRLLPALLGHLALFEMTSIGPMGRYSHALARLGVSEEGRHFYDAHVVADEVHSQLALRDLIDGFLEAEPDVAPEISFGAAALTHVEAALSSHLLDSWTAKRTSLLQSPASHGDDIDRDAA